MRSLLTIEARNFMSLQSVSVDLQELSVLVGTNGAGKSNLLKVIQFLGDTARLDLGPAIDNHGGFDRIFFRGGKQASNIVQLRLVGLFTKNSSISAPDEYQLSFRQQLSLNSAVRFSHRMEDFVFKRTAGRGRRISVSGSKVGIEETGSKKPAQRQLSLSNASSGLSTLPRLGKGEGGEQISALSDLLTTFRVFEVNVDRARRPSVGVDGDASNSAVVLNSNASNIAAFLQWLEHAHEDVFDQYQEDLAAIAPSVKKVRIKKIGGVHESAVAIQLEERGVKGLTNLSEASFGTVRAMGLLAMLHDPRPPRLTCVEEIDHGLHPHALDRIVERLRDASKRTQLLVVTHSPALANRLSPKELIVCERDYDSGASKIPAIDAATVAAMVDASQLSLGELWFSGALGGGL